MSYSGTLIKLQAVKATHGQPVIDVSLEAAQLWRQINYYGK